MIKTVLIGVCLFNVGCTMPKQKSYRDYNLLSSGEIEFVTETAIAGDGVACRRLYRHYYIGLGEFKVGIFWLEKGAQFGDEKCMDILKSMPPLPDS